MAVCVCRCGCKLRAWDNMVLAPWGCSLPPHCCSACSRRRRSGGGALMSCDVRLVLVSYACRLCVCGSDHTDWFYLLFPVLEGMARLCRPRPSWIKPPINVKVSCGFKQAFIFKFTFSRSFEFKHQTRLRLYEIMIWRKLLNICIKNEEVEMAVVPFPWSFFMQMNKAKESPVTS